MLRINLLPAYVAQRRITRALTAVYGAALIVVLLVLGVWGTYLSSADAAMKTKADQATAAKAVIDGVNAQASSVTSSLAPIQADLDFVNQIKTYNLTYIKLYQTVADYTSPKILYNSMDLTGGVLTISGYTPSMADLGRYLLEMYKEPDATSVALTSPIPGYGAANPDAPQTLTVPAGVVGRLPGVAGQVYSYTVYRGKITAVNSGGATGGTNPQFGAIGGFNPAFGGMRGAAGMPMGQFNPMMQGRTQTPGAAGNLFNPRKDGFPFTVELTLKTPPTPPTPPTTPTAVPVGGGAGQFGGGFTGGRPFGGMPFGAGGPPGAFGRPGMGGPPPGFTPPGAGPPLGFTPHGPQSAQ